MVGARDPKSTEGCPCLLQAADWGQLRGLHSGTGVKAYTRWKHTCESMFREAVSTFTCGFPRDYELIDSVKSTRSEAGKKN